MFAIEIFVIFDDQDDSVDSLDCPKKCHLSIFSPPIQDVMNIFHRSWLTHFRHTRLEIRPVFWLRNLQLWCGRPNVVCTNLFPGLAPLQLPCWPIQWCGPSWTTLMAMRSARSGG